MSSPPQLHALISKQTKLVSDWNYTMLNAGASLDI